MMIAELTKELYKAAFDDVRAPAELMTKIDDFNRDDKPKAKRLILRRVLIAAALVIGLFAASNLVVYAATGETWVEKLVRIEYDPQKPMENVREYFIVNDDKLKETYEYPRRDIYGGTYLDGGTQVILLTDLSNIGEYADFGDNVRFEQCRYTYAELNGTMNKLNEILPLMIRRHDVAAKDVVSWGIDEKDNCIIVSIYNMDDDKVKWFRENVCDKEYLVFVNTDSRLMDLDALPKED